MNMENIENLIFDVDGTLWNSVPLVAKGWNLALKELGMEANCTPEGIQSYFGKTMTEIADGILSQVEVPERYRRMERLMACEHQVMQEDPCHIFYPDVKETLETLSKHYRLFIVSNCQKGYIELLLEKGNLAHLIQDHTCFGETGTCKAHSILTLMQRNGIRNACYIGDTQGDLEAAQGAGIPFVWASYGFGTPETWDEKVTSFSQLAELFPGK